MMAAKATTTATGACEAAGGSCNCCCPSSCRCRCCSCRRCLLHRLPRPRAAPALRAGANDLGGVLMNESITRAAGGQNGQEFGAAEMMRLADDLGRPHRERSTVYGEPPSRPPVAAPTPELV